MKRQTRTPEARAKMSAAAKRVWATNAAARERRLAGLAAGRETQRLLGGLDLIERKFSAKVRYWRGDSTVLIARDLGCTSQWVSSMAIQSGVRPRNPKKHLTQEDMEVIRLAKGVRGAPSVAKELGIHHSTVQYHWKKMESNKCGAR